MQPELSATTARTVAEPYQPGFSYYCTNERSTLSTNTLLSLKLNLLQVFLLNQIIIDERKFCSTVKQWSTHVVHVTTESVRGLCNTRDRM